MRPEDEAGATRRMNQKSVPIRNLQTWDGYSRAATTGAEPSRTLIDARDTTISTALARLASAAFRFATLAVVASRRQLAQSQ